MKYQFSGPVVSIDRSYLGIPEHLAVSYSEEDAERFAAELNRLAEERDALLAACKKAEEDLCHFYADDTAAVRNIRAAIAKCEGGEA